MLLVEQNAMMALSIATRGYVLEVGHIVLQGTAEELSNNKQVQNLLPRRTITPSLNFTSSAFFDCTAFRSECA